MAKPDSPPGQNKPEEGGPPEHSQAGGKPRVENPIVKPDDDDNEVDNTLPEPESPTAEPK